MTIADLDRWLTGFLSLDAAAGTDRSTNGLQVGRRDAAVTRVAFAVDASMESFRRAAAAGAQALVVHHGLFWGEPLMVVGTHYERLRFLLENGLALWAAHFPLDMHPEVGNNAGIARALGLLEVEAFGEHRGVRIGCRGRLPSPLPLERVVDLLRARQGEPVRTLPFGRAAVSTVGIVSGAAARDVVQATALGLDAFVTGEPSHEVYHHCLEEGIHAIFAGHYHTESWGVQALAERLARDTGVETTYVDVPTGL